MAETGIFLVPTDYPRDGQREPDAEVVAGRLVVDGAAPTFVDALWATAHLARQVADAGASIDPVFALAALSRLAPGVT